MRAETSIKYGPIPYRLTIVIRRDGKSMGLSRIMELVSQAEREGITLAAMMSKEMSPEEMELVQDELAIHMNDNYSRIEKFMAGVSVPSMEELLSRRDELPVGFELDAIGPLSDDFEFEEEES